MRSPGPSSSRVENDLTVQIRCASGNVYEYRDGEPTIISAGTLLENIAIAAPGLGKRSSWRYLGEAGGVHNIAVHFEDGPVSPSPLLSAIWQRSVDRRPYRLTKLTPDAKAQLTRAAAGDVAVEWFESWGERRRIAALTNQATDIRLRIPETFEIHRRMIDWDRNLSPTGLPSHALGLDAMTLKIMRWSMAEWKRLDFGNRMGSPMFAGLQMDILPGLLSAAYFAFRAPPAAAGSERVAQLLRTGQAVQRFWLTATRLGLAMQPCQAVLAFTHYAPPTRRSRPIRSSAAGRSGWQKPLHRC